ncbi:MAG: class I SAM-dependent methyltransferase [Candidatus Thermoplasmatota archaeon]|nr:class I SAM-dependent methyltransferase [Candidatus Thermoplasmatota archaeon]
MRYNGDETILDFGCGGGASSKPILNKMSNKGTLICLDTSKEWINKAKKRFGLRENVVFINKDIVDAKIANESIDLISMTYVLHDIFKKRQSEIIHLLSKKLKPNGRLAIREPTKPHHGIQPAEIHKFMKQNNLRIIQEEHETSKYFGLFIKQ